MVYYVDCLPRNVVQCLTVAPRQGSKREQISTGIAGSNSAGWGSRVHFTMAGTPRHGI